VGEILVLKQVLATVQHQHQHKDESTSLTQGDPWSTLQLTPYTLLLDDIQILDTSATPCGDGVVIMIEGQPLP
jgi:hypothetical protein